MSEKDFYKITPSSFCGRNSGRGMIKEIFITRICAFLQFPVLDVSEFYFEAVLYVRVFVADLC